jgi:sialate O-acetylesterase
MSLLKVAPIFSDNMVLQRDKNINIWGTGNNGDIVKVALGDTNVSAKVKDNKWMAIMPSMEAGGPYTVNVTVGKDSITFSNVMIGEVWLAGGQSNMELELQNSRDGKNVVANINSNINKNKVRFYYTQKLSYIDEEFYEKEASRAWQECSPETVGDWSAVGYYYAQKLAEELNVTVGVIGCNWGGTSASAWMSKEMLELDKDTNTYLEEYDKVNEGRSFEEYLKELEEYNAWYPAWQKRVDKCYAENPGILWSEVLEIAGESRWPEPLGPKSPYRPSGLYETMVKRVMPYTLRGFIYYQGESDDHKPKIYGKLLTKLIEQWRTDWEDEELPFILVQLPMFIGRGDEDKKHWAAIREHQMRVHKTIKNTGIAVALDCGEFDNIHPVDKEPVGFRLAQQALYQVYGKDVAAYGPIYKSIAYAGSSIELTFDHAEDGIVIKGDKAEGFEIAGEDKEFVRADIKIDGDKILVSASQVLEPKYVRYAWTNYGPVTLFNKAGLPMAPFRTSAKDEKL